MVTAPFSTHLPTNVTLSMSRHWSLNCHRSLGLFFLFLFLPEELEPELELELPESDVPELNIKEAREMA